MKDKDDLNTIIRILSSIEFIIITFFIVLLVGVYYQDASKPTFASPLNIPPPVSGKQFFMLAPGTILSSSEQCETRIRHTTWEPRPINYLYNQSLAIQGIDYNIVPYKGTDRGIYFSGHALRANALLNRVNGNFTGTTDEILQWAACKWGFDEDVARAQAVVESSWNMSTNGDNGESFGLLQVRKPFFSDAFPAAQKSTAFNADFAFGYWRLCYEGLLDFLGEGTNYQAGDEWGCIGKWYTGNWYGSGGGNGEGAQFYINNVKQKLAERTWEQWKGVQISITPTQIKCKLKSLGDANCSGRIDLIDFEIYRKEMTSLLFSRLADYNNDGRVSIVDFEIWRRNGIP